MLPRNLASCVLVFILLMLTIGCSRGSSPLAPQSPDQGLAATGGRAVSSASHVCWGIWQVSIDAATSEAEVIPLRTAEWHVNTVPFLEKKGQSKMVLRDIIIDGSEVELNVGLVHPFITLYQWSGFDVRGIFITDGSFDGFASDGDIVISEPDEPKLINADGWARWWNPTEFPKHGSILGYTDGIYGAKYSQVHYRKTVSPYKYFADDLTQNEDFPGGLDFARRGVFTAKSSPNWRHYSIDFGAPANRYVFNYAVDASHQFDPSYDGHSTPSLSQIPDPFFPIEANQPEAFAVVPEDVANTLYYASPTEFGGDLLLSISIYDWQGLRREGTIMDEIEQVLVESPALIGDELVTATPLPSPSDTDRSVYVADLSNCHPDGLYNQDILITVISSEGSFEDGYDGFPTGFTGHAPLAAYCVYTPSVSPDVPVQTQYITLYSPNGGEIWLSGSSNDITWFGSPSIEFVKIEYSANGGGTWLPIDGGSGILPNNGTYLWNIPPSLASAHMLVRISDASDGDPVDQSDDLFAIETLTVTVPNGPADKYEVGVAKDIEWETGTGTADVVEYVKIELSKNGMSGPFVQLPGANNLPNTGSWSWTPLMADITTTGRIRVTDVDHAALTDTSDGNFEVFFKPELTLDEYRSWFTGGTLTYRGRRTTLSSLSQSYYDGTYTSWNFTSTPLSTYIGSTNFTVQFSSSVPLIAGAPAWGANNWGMRTSIAGPANRRAWWVFRFDQTNERLYNRGSTYYQDATFTDISNPGICWDYIACDMTEQFGVGSSNVIQFPLDKDSATSALGGSGYLYWVNYDLLCNPYNDQWSVAYQTGSEWDVIAQGDVTVPHGGGTNYPYCLLIRLKIEIGPTTQIVHTGQLLYQWVDCDTGKVVAFIWTHNEGNSTVGIPYTTGFSGDQVLQGIIGAYN